METWTPSTARVQVELDRLDTDFQTLSNYGVYAGIEDLILEIRRKECTNWCQRVAEWLKAEFDEEIPVWPSNASMPFSDLWDF